MRKRLSKKKSYKIFKNGVLKVHKKNLRRRAMRGGVRS